MNYWKLEDSFRIQDLDKLEQTYRHLLPKATIKGYQLKNQPKTRYITERMNGLRANENGFKQVMSIHEQIDSDRIAILRNLIFFQRKKNGIWGGSWGTFPPRNNDKDYKSTQSI